MFTVRTHETRERTRKNHETPDPHPQNSYPQDVGYGFQGYGYGLARVTPGLPMVFPIEPPVAVQHLGKIK